MKNNDLEYSVSGIIRDYESGAPLKNLRVRAYDKDFFRNQWLGDDSTDENGRYEIRFRREDFTGAIIKLERHPDLFLHVFDQEGELIHSTQKSVRVDSDRQTSIDINLKYNGHRRAAESITQLLGVPINITEVAKLSAEEVLGAYRLMRNPALQLRNADRIRKAFPGLYRRSQAPLECGNPVREMFRFLMKERNAEALFDGAEADPYNGATVKQFFTANIVVKYTTDATLPDGTANPNKLPAASATLPTSDSNYTMPNGTLIGVVRSNLADLDPSNTEVAPTYIQKIGLLAEYSLSHYINPPFSFLDPRGGLARLEFRILNLGQGFAGYAVPDFHMELNTSNDDLQNLGTVPHELFHLVQYRYNDGPTLAGGVRQVTLEGGARLLEESINESRNRYVESAAEGDLSTAPVPRKGIFSFPDETLIDVGGSSSLLRYAAGLLWKYIAEHHSNLTGASDEPAIGVDSYRKIIERMTTANDGFSITAIRNGRSQLPWYGSFDQFGYFDAAATELSTHETTWGNFLLANYYHKLWTPATTGFDQRFDYLEDDDPAGQFGAQLNTLSPAIKPGNAVTIGQGAAITKNVTGHKPYAAVYYELTPDAASAPRMLRVNFSTSNGMTDPLIQIVRIGAGNALVDIHRSDRTNYSKTINMAGLSKVLVIVASKEHGGDFSIHFDEIVAASDVMVTRWNTRVGTEYEADPKGWSWTWISPDIMVDTNNDTMDDTSVFFGQNNKLKVRLRNRGNADASNVRIDFWYQRATTGLSSAGWIPVQDFGGTTQQLTGLTLAAGAEQWFEVNWCPADDGTHATHWCVKVLVTCATDPNLDNKMAFRNFNNLTTAGPDFDFTAVVRYPYWTERDLIFIVPRDREWNIRLQNREAFDKVTTRARDCEVAAAHRFTFGVPYDLTFAQLRLEKAALTKWDGRNTKLPHDSGFYYPVDERTLPPGVKPNEIITVAHVRGGHVIGGISYRVSKQR